MARKSRKFNKNMSPPVSPSHKYSVGAYLRVSVESDSSIFSQEAILTKYIKEHSEFQLHKLYVDNGVSSFFEERTEFDKLIRDAEAKIIDCIIVKDFSRFTRDYIEFGDYLEQIFPVWGIRFISIFDNYDSEGIYGITDFTAALRSIINASYSRDISTKVKSSVKIKQLKGTYIAARLPYGYSKNKVEAQQYVIDNATVQVVRNIYNLALEGNNAFEIAGWLNSSGVAPPGKVSTSDNGSAIWTRSTIMQILRNKAYIGCLVTGKTENTPWKLLAAKKMPKDEWIITPNHHEPIISEDIFNKVQMILDQQRMNFKWAGGSKTSREYLSRLLFCGYCGRKMKRRVWKGKTYYVCPRSKEARGACSSKSVSEEKLRSDVFEAIQMEIEKARAYQEQQLCYERTLAYNIKRDYMNAQQENMINKRKYLDDAGVAFYTAMQDGEYTKSDLQVFNKNKAAVLMDLLSGIQNIEQQNKDYDENYASCCKGIETLLSYATSSELSDDMLSELVRRIRCYDDKSEIEVPAFS